MLQRSDDDKGPACCEGDKPVELIRVDVRAEGEREAHGFVIIEGQRARIDAKQPRRSHARLPCRVVGGDEDSRPLRSVQYDGDHVTVVCEPGVDPIQHDPSRIIVADQGVDDRGAKLGKRAVDPDHRPPRSVRHLGSNRRRPVAIGGSEQDHTARLRLEKSVDETRSCQRPSGESGQGARRHPRWGLHVTRHRMTVRTERSMHLRSGDLRPLVVRAG